MDKTIQDLVDDVAQSANAIGIDVSSKDVGWMISLFLQAIADYPTGQSFPQADKWLLLIAEECDSVRNE